jgi:hypothetical protein
MQVALALVESGRTNVVLSCQKRTLDASRAGLQRPGLFSEGGTLPATGFGEMSRENHRDTVSRGLDMPVRIWAGLCRRLSWPPLPELSRESTTDIDYSRPWQAAGRSPVQEAIA